MRVETSWVCSYLMTAAGVNVPSQPTNTAALKSWDCGEVTDPRLYTATTALPGLPAPLALIWAATGAAWFWASVENDRVAAVFSANEPALGAAVRTYLGADPPAPAVAPALGVEPPLAALFVPVLVRWTTSSTITTTPTTDDSRYRTIRIPPRRGGAPRWPDRDEPERDGGPGGVKSASP